MIVRIRFKLGPKIERRRGKNSRLALLAASMLSLASVTCFILGLWRLCADLGVAEAFVITDGLLSHWQVWVVVSVLLQYVAWRLTRYGRLNQQEQLLNPEHVADKAPARP